MPEIRHESKVTSNMNFRTDGGRHNSMLTCLYDFNLQTRRIIEMMNGFKENAVQSGNGVQNSNWMRLTQWRVTLEERFEWATFEFEKFLAQLSTEITEWRFEYRSGKENFYSEDDVKLAHLSQIQILYLNGAHILIEVRKQIQTAALELYVTETDDGTMFSSCSDKVTSLVRRMMEIGFIVETQPSQVVTVKKSMSNPLKVCHLAGKTFFENSDWSAKVEVSLIDETQALALIAGTLDLVKVSRCSDMYRGIEALKLDEVTQRLSANFEMLQLVGKVKRKAQTPGHRVYDVPLTFLCQAKFKVGLNTFTIWTLTSPVIVITNTVSQGGRARANVLWNNAFPIKSNSHPFAFDIVLEVSFQEIGKILNSETNHLLGSPLTDFHLEFLKNKLCPLRPDLGGRIEIVTKAGFCQDLLSGFEFTFWEWFYAALQLVGSGDGLPFGKHAWSKGYIYGFISKRDDIKLLESCLPGTYLVRFAESTLGAFSVAWVASDREIKHIGSITENDLKIISFTQRLMDLKVFRQLYGFSEFISIEKAFGPLPQSQVIPTQEPAPGDYTEVGITATFRTSTEESSPTLAHSENPCPSPMSRNPIPIFPTTLDFWSDLTQGIDVVEPVWTEMDQIENSLMFDI